MAGQIWQTTGLGGFLANPRLSAKIRHAAQPMMRFRQFIRPEPGYGAHKSDKILFDRISNVLVGGGSISELSKMPEDSVSITQGNVTVNEFGNSVPFTGKLEQLSEFNVDNILQKALMNDEAKVLDKQVAATFKGTVVKATPTGTLAAPVVTFNETSSPTTATRDITTFDVKEIVDRLKSVYFTPKYDGENYICITSVGGARAIKDDPDWEDAAKYGEPERLFAGEIGRYYGVRFVEESNALANLMGSSNFKGEQVYFGEDPVVEGVAVPEELRVKIPQDYGRDQGIAWYALLGWALTFSTANAGENKVIHNTAT